MHIRKVIFGLLVILNGFLPSTDSKIAAEGKSAFNYPNVRRDVNVSENYHGVKVEDPYRWLETPQSQEVKDFVKNQNALTVEYLESASIRQSIREKLSSLWNYEKSNAPEKHGNHFFQYVNSGLQNQMVLYIQDALEAPTNRRVFIDPNKLSEDGTLAMTFTQKFSKNGTIFAYGVSKSGSDWVTVHFRDVSTGEDLPDVLTKVKFTDIVWKGDDGIFYGHYPLFEGDPEGSDTGTNEDQKISYHKIGTKQEDDPIVVEFPSHPKSLIASDMAISKEGTILIVTPEAGEGEGSYGDQSVYYIKMENEDPKTWNETLSPIVSQFKAKFKYVMNNEDEFYFITNYRAPNYRVIRIDLRRPEESEWTELILEDKNNVLDWVTPINTNYLVLNYLENVQSKLELRHISNGTLIKNLDIEMGSIQGFSGGMSDSILFIKFVSFLVPNRIYCINFEKTNGKIENTKLEILQDSSIQGFDSNLFEAVQVNYGSKDNTSIPMFLVYKKGFIKNGEQPAMIYGYGGFNINILPEFSVPRIVFMESFEGVVAIANIRGGGEFGKEWHEGGSLGNKQNVFDDFQAAAKYLIYNNYTTAAKIVIEGRSNGGLLVGACVNQAPELYGAAIASVGVMDMLRYHKFTIGHSWIPEYGSSDNREQFPYIYKYSPLHNIKSPTETSIPYPAVLVTTSDHDDRVVPSHSYKYAAELQYIVGNSDLQTHPLLLRIETDAGHGAGTPTSKLIDEQVDIFSFISKSMNLHVNASQRLNMSAILIVLTSLVTFLTHVLN